MSVEKGEIKKPSPERVKLVGEHYEMYGQFVHKKALNMLGATEADDVVMDVFLKELEVDELLFESEPDHGYRNLQIKRWLSTTTFNKCIDRIRRRKIIKMIPLEEDPKILRRPTESRFEQPLEMTLLSIEQDMVDIVLAKLPDKQRFVLTLFEYDEMTYEQIAAEIDTTPGTIKTLLFRARAKFRRHYGIISDTYKSNGVINDAI